ncbi:hypothetical protein BHE74_00016476 [Ensete ventricosum]|nr:hypothetical protein GW17_00017249 [Ensete ventricosum]RWW75496.1 hypothetical protein BHE74_00016476 [Ensete ventricosum]RZR96011.1 hypothetical protein BHM03_00024937 [Ensete ventricosum]
MRTARYRMVPSIGVVSAPISTVAARYRAVSTEREEEGEEKKELGDPTSLSFDDLVPLPPSLATRRTLQMRCRLLLV